MAAKVNNMSRRDVTARIKVEDDPAAIWLTYSRILHNITSLTQGFIQLIRLTIIQQNIEALKVQALTQAYIAAAVAKYARFLGPIGIAASIAASIAAMYALSQAQAIPAAQTHPGQFRLARSTSPVILHAGETVSPPYAGVKIRIRNMNLTENGISVDALASQIAWKVKRAWQR